MFTTIDTMIIDKSRETFAGWARQAPPLGLPVLGRLRGVTLRAKPGALRGTALLLSFASFVGIATMTAVILAPQG